MSEQHPRGEDVRGRRDAPAGDLLGRREAQGAHGSRRDRGELGDARDAEVEHLDALAARDLREEDVARFEVAVDDSLAVRVLDRLEHQVEDLQRSADGEAAADERLVERRALEPLHHDVLRAVRVDGVVEDLDHVGVPQAHGGDRFAPEALLPAPGRQAGSGAGQGGEELDRHGLLQAQVGRLEDAAHAAPPDYASDAVFLVVDPVGVFVLHLRRRELDQLAAVERAAAVGRALVEESLAAPAHPRRHGRTVAPGRRERQSGEGNPDRAVRSPRR